MWPDPHRCTIPLETQYDPVFDEPYHLVTKVQNYLVNPFVLLPHTTKVTR
jgi:hypothetical protein